MARLRGSIVVQSIAGGTLPVMRVLGWACLLVLLAVAPFAAPAYNQDFSEAFDIPEGAPGDSLELPTMLDSLIQRNPPPIDTLAPQDSVALFLPDTVTPLPELTPKDSADAIADLSNKLNRILSSRYARRNKYGVLVQSHQSDKILYSKNSDDVFTPASTTKLVTTYMALYLHSAEHALATSISTDAPEIRNGLLDGNLYLTGGGDPLLNTADFELLADKIRGLGIDSISGNIYATGEIFDTVYNRLHYSGDRDIVQALPPVAGITINHNEITVRVTAPSRPGLPLQVQTIPVSDAVSFTVNAKSRNGRYYSRSVKFTSSLVDSNGIQHFTVGGYLKPGRSYAYKFESKNPPMIAAALLHSRLQAGGVKIGGGFDVQSPPIISMPLTSAFRSLRDIVMVTNKNSNNFFAENLFKLIGSYSAPRGGSTSKEARILTTGTMDDEHIRFDNCLINDGSGLSRRNLLSPQALVDILGNAYDQPFGQAYYNSLSIAGVDGTLKGRMRGTAAEDNLCAKTGTLRNASGLAGYVTTRDGELLTFAIMFNGYSVSSFKKLENSIGEALANFTYGNPGPAGG